MLRSSLSLAMVTGKTFRITNIRANRQKPGLMRQHLTCVRAAARICNARVRGAEVGSMDLTFTPGPVQAGDYHFAIGTAGSTALVAQTVIPALMMADGRSRVIIDGGTHNIQAPTYDFLEHSYLPLLRKMGVQISSSIEKYGFYPAGGGRITFDIQRQETLKPLNLLTRGALRQVSATALFAHLDPGIARRELAEIGERLSWPAEALHMRQINDVQSSGNNVVLRLEFDELSETIVGFGRRGVKAEKVAAEACQEAAEYLVGPAAVGLHLADQLLVPMVLVGKGAFTTLSPTQHTRTNIDVIGKFLPGSIVMDEHVGQWTVTISRPGDL